MYQNFPLFRSHLDLAHQYWKMVLKEGDWALDATCGNGLDTLALAATLRAYKQWGLVGIDIQKKAVDHTRGLLQLNLSEEQMTSVHLFQQSHLQFPPLAYQHPIRVIVYNLGYLPGGDKSLMTQTATTLSSVETALQLLQPGGIVSITCYPGHEEGSLEQTALLQRLVSLKNSDWSVCHHTFLNRASSPSLILVQKSQK